MRILHLSDMHYMKDSDNNFEMNLLNPMLEDLRKLADEKVFDLIIYSGDLVDKAGKSFENDLTLGLMEFEQNVIEPLLNALNLDKSRFIIVPGNHDIERDLDSKIIEKGLLAELNTYKTVADFMAERRKNDNWEGIKRIKTFKEFEKEFYNRDDISKFETTHICETGNKIGIAALNTSWRCYDSKIDKGNIILGESQIDNALKEFKDKSCNLKIAVLHHPIDELHPFEVKDIENKICREFDIVFSGHVHFQNLI